MRTPRAVAVVILVGLIGTACGARLPQDVNTAAKNAVLSTGGGGTGTTYPTGTASTGTTGAASTGTTGTASTGTTGAASTGTTGAASTGTTGGAKGATKDTTSGGAKNPSGNSGSSGGCPPSTTGPGLTGSSMTLGTIADRTGPVAGLFAGAEQGAEAFAQYENSNGGLCGRSVNIQFADSGTNCSQDQDDTEALVNKVFAFVGSFSLYDGIGCGATVLKAHPTVPDIGVAIDPTAETLPNHFDLEPGPLGYATGMWAYYKKQFGSKVQHVGTISVDIPSAQEKQEAVVHAAESQGWKFVYQSAASATTSNFTSYFETMCGRDHIQIFFELATNAQNAATMMANERSIAACKGVVNVIPIAYDSAFLPDYQGSASDLDIYGYSEYSLFFNADEAARIPEVALFQQWFKRTNPGQPLNPYAMFAWASGRLLQDAYEHAKTGSQAGVMAALRKLKNWSDNGLIAPTTPSSKTVGNHCYILWHLSDGKFSRTADPKPTATNPGGYRCDGTFLKY